MIPASLNHIPLEKAEFSVVDVETTGLSARNNRESADKDAMYKITKGKTS